MIIVQAIDINNFPYFTLLHLIEIILAHTQRLIKHDNNNRNSGILFLDSLFTLSIKASLSLLLLTANFEFVYYTLYG